MKLSFKKINTNKLYGAALWLLLLLLIGYEAYLVYGLNRDLQVPQSALPERVTRFDTQKFNSALELYDSYTKTQTVTDIPDPFNVVVATQTTSGLGQ